MSGTARLVGHRVEILADEPITGPLPTSTLMSYITINGSGYRATVVKATASGAQIIGSGTSSDINFNAATVSTYLPPGTIPSETTTVPVLSANQITFNGATGFLGTVTLRLALNSSKGAYVSPPENISVSIYVNDNIGGAEEYRQTIPVLVFGGNPQYFETSVTVCFPTTPARTSMNFYCGLVNSQAADGIVVTVGKFDVTQFQ